MQSLFYPLSILSNRRIPLTTRLCAAHRRKLLLLPRVFYDARFAYHRDSDPARIA